MFAIRGGIAGDGVAGFKGEVGMVGVGVLPQTSRNRHREKLGGEGARGDIGFWVSGRVWLSSDSADLRGGVDNGREDGGEEEVEEVSTVGGLAGGGTGVSWLEGWVVMGVRGRLFQRCISRWFWTSSLDITSIQTEHVYAILKL
jgi:hypothetical protein